MKLYLDAKSEDGDDQLEYQGQGQLPHGSINLKIKSIFIS
jgi:hypothetical protein